MGTLLVKDLAQFDPMVEFEDLARLMEAATASDVALTTTQIDRLLGVHAGW